MVGYVVAMTAFLVELEVITNIALVSFSPLLWGFAGYIFGWQFTEMRINRRQDFILAVLAQRRGYHKSAIRLFDRVLSDDGWKVSFVEQTKMDERVMQLREVSVAALTSARQAH